MVRSMTYTNVAASCMVRNIFSESINIIEHVGLKPWWQWIWFTIACLVGIRLAENWKLSMASWPPPPLVSHAVFLPLHPGEFISEKYEIRNNLSFEKRISLQPSSCQRALSGPSLYDKTTFQPLSTSRRQFAKNVTQELTLVALLLLSESDTDYTTLD